MDALLIVIAVVATSAALHATLCTWAGAGLSDIDALLGTRGNF
jgi:hypothetical protein